MQKSNILIDPLCSSYNPSFLGKGCGPIEGNQNETTEKHIKRTYRGDSQ